MNVVECLMPMLKQADCIADYLFPMTGSVKMSFTRVEQIPMVKCEMNNSLQSVDAIDVSNIYDRED